MTVGISQDHASDGWAAHIVDAGRGRASYVDSVEMYNAFHDPAVGRLRRTILSEIVAVLPT